MGLWKNVLEIVVSVAGSHTNKVGEGVAACKQMKCYQNPGKVSALNWEPIDLHGQVRYKLRPHIQHTKYIRALHHHVLASKPAVNDPSHCVEQEHRGQLRLFILEMTLHLAERIVDHHHCKQKIHTEPSRKEESRHKPPDLPLVKHRGEIKKQLVGAENLVSHAEGQEECPTEVVPCYWRYF